MLEGLMSRLRGKLQEETPVQAPSKSPESFPTGRLAREKSKLFEIGKMYTIPAGTRLESGSFSTVLREPVRVKCQAIDYDHFTFSADPPISMQSRDSGNVRPIPTFQLPRSLEDLLQK